jgi:hypothetical protein
MVKHPLVATCDDSMAKLDKAPDYGSGDSGFESLWSLLRFFVHVLCLGGHSTMRAVAAALLVAACCFHPACADAGDSLVRKLRSRRISDSLVEVRSTVRPARLVFPRPRSPILTCVCVRVHGVCLLPAQLPGADEIIFLYSTLGAPSVAVAHFDQTNVTTVLANASAIEFSAQPRSWLVMALDSLLVFSDAQKSGVLSANTPVFDSRPLSADPASRPGSVWSPIALLHDHNPLAATTCSADNVTCIQVWPLSS